MQPATKGFVGEDMRLAALSIMCGAIFDRNQSLEVHPAPLGNGWGMRNRGHTDTSRDATALN